MSVQVYREEWAAMALGVAVAFGGLALWYLDVVANGWLLVPAGGALTGYVADEGFEAAALAVLPLVMLTAAGAVIYAATLDEYAGMAGITALVVLSGLVIQLALVLALPFMIAGGVGNWVENRMAGES